LKITFKPHPRQFEALQYLQDDKTNEVLFWGWARWGKSYFACAWIIIECLAKPWSAWLIWRYELKRLKATTLVTFFEVMRDLKLDQKLINYNASEWVISFPNWSTIFLMDLSHKPSDPEYNRLGSYWLTWCFIDEAQEVNFKAINVLKGRFSLLEAKDWSWRTIPKMLYTCNPAKGWIYNEFYIKDKEGTLENNKVFVPSLVTDNKHISEEYINQLKTADKVTVERLLKWNFDYDDTPWKLYHYDALISLFRNNIHSWDKYITCDVARQWRDKAVIAVWDWWNVIAKTVHLKNKITELEVDIRRFASQYNIPMYRIVVDEDWVGWWLVDNLWCKWFVNNSSAIDTRTEQEKWQKKPKPNFPNLKTQCFFWLIPFINDWIINLSVFEEYKQEIIEELDVIAEKDLDKDWVKKIISKDDIKELIWRSPDFADAIMMRFYFELISIPSKTMEQVEIEIEEDTEAYLLALQG